MNFRYARHTDNLKKISDFYTQILGLELLGNFDSHNGYDGIFLGKPNQNWHLEFTVSEEIPARKFDEDDLLVFYPETKDEFDQILKSIEIQSIKIQEPKNPYWKENGILIKDPDGFGIIISPLKIKI